MSDQTRNIPMPGSFPGEDEGEIPVHYFIDNLDEVNAESVEEPVALPPPPIIRPITPGLSTRGRVRAGSAEAGEGSTSRPAETRHFSDTEMLAYVEMRGITGHGHYPHDEALEPLARVMYEPTTIEGVQAEVNRAIQEQMELRGGGSGGEPAAFAKETATWSTQEEEEEATIQPLQMVLPLTEPAQEDNRHRQVVLYQNQNQDRDQEEDDGKSETEDGKDGKSRDEEKGKVSKPQAPPPSSPSNNPQPSPYESPFGLQVRGRYYQPHSAITELSERTEIWEEQGFSRSPSRSFSNGSSHVSDGSAKSNSDNSSTPSTPPGETFVKMSFLQEGDVSDDEGMDAGGISPRTFLKLSEGCATRNRHFRVGGPAKVEVPANLERTRPSTPPIETMPDVPPSPSQHTYESQYDAYDGDEMTAHYSVPSNPSVKWAPTGVPHTNFAGRMELFTLDRMDPVAGRELVHRRYGQPESAQGTDDDSGVGASASTSTATATATAARAVAGPSTLLEDGTRPVSNIADWSPIKAPGESEPRFVYVGDLPPRIQIDERNIPRLRKAVRFDQDPERQVRERVSVPPGFEQHFEQHITHARELKSSSAANPFGGQQHRIDMKGKGRMVDEVSSPFDSATMAYGQHSIDWKGKGKEIIFSQESLSSGGSGSSLEMTELKAGPPPKLLDYQVEQTREAGPLQLPYAHVETYGYDEAEDAITNAPPGTLADGIQGHEAREELEARNRAMVDLEKREAETRVENAALEREVDELERIRPLVKELIESEIFQALSARLHAELAQDSLAFGGLFNPAITTNEEADAIIDRITSRPFPTSHDRSQYRSRPQHFASSSSAHATTSAPTKKIRKESDLDRPAQMRQYFNDQILQIKYKTDMAWVAVMRADDTQIKLKQKKDQKVTAIGEILESLGRMGVEDTNELFEQAQASVRVEMEMEEGRRREWVERQEWKGKGKKDV
ncbi:hypothetical protein QBC45DRAFT_475036 [Copromyces sp. CBS 386.78]|nr:hypothetical protein QBC45DRAFT_475036 [Copromyces sp. CBS 386.78]